MGLGLSGDRTRITVHMGTCGISSGADKVLKRLNEEIAATASKAIAITTSGCAGICIGGGVPKGKKFKAVQLGGPSGGCVPAAHLNTPVDYESIIRYIPDRVG